MTFRQVAGGPGFFESDNHTISSDLIDNPTGEPVPLPGTALLQGAGLGLIGIAASAFGPVRRDLRGPGRAAGRALNPIADASTLGTHASQSAAPAEPGPEPDPITQSPPARARPSARALATALVLAVSVVSLGPPASADEDGAVCSMRSAPAWPPATSSPPR